MINKRYEVMISVRDLCCSAGYQELYFHDDVTAESVKESVLKALESVYSEEE